MVNSLYSCDHNGHKSKFLRAQACKILGLFGNFETVNPAFVGKFVVILDTVRIHDRADFFDVFFTIEIEKHPDADAVCCRINRQPAAEIVFAAQLLHSQREISVSAAVELPVFFDEFQNVLFVNSFALHVFFFHERFAVVVLDN